MIKNYRNRNLQIRQLRAISYACTKRDQDKALEELEDRYNLDFYDFAGKMLYKGSPVRLLTDLKRYSVKTWNRVSDYACRYHKNVGEDA